MPGVQNRHQLQPRPTPRLAGSRPVLRAQEQSNKAGRNLAQARSSLSHSVSPCPQAATTQLHSENSDDAHKCSDALYKLVALRRGSSMDELIDILRLFLPSSPFHHALTASTLPHLEELIGLLESREAEQLIYEANRRRTRLDASGKSKEQVEREVGRELWSTSEVALSLSFVDCPLMLDRFLLCMKKFCHTPMPLTNCVVRQNRSYFFFVTVSFVHCRSLSGTRSALKCYNWLTESSYLEYRMNWPGRYTSTPGTFSVCKTLKTLLIDIVRFFRPHL